MPTKRIVGINMHCPVVCKALTIRYPGGGGGGACIELKKIIVP